MPKETVLFYSSNHDISLEFAIAAYIGQQLNEISSFFTYKIAALAKPDYFIFTFATNDLDVLVEILAEASSVFGNSDLIEPINFSSSVSDFTEIIPKNIACRDIIDTSLEYYQASQDA